MVSVKEVPLKYSELWYTSVYRVGARVCGCVCGGRACVHNLTRLQGIVDGASLSSSIPKNGNRVRDSEAAVKINVCAVPGNMSALRFGCLTCHSQTMALLYHTGVPATSAQVKNPLTRSSRRSCTVRVHSRAVHKARMVPWSVRKIREKFRSAGFRC